MPYIGQGLTEGRRRAYNFVATSNQTTFTATYDVGYVDVYQNGILLSTTDYTATNGTTVVLGVGASASDEITIIAHQIFSITDTVSASQGGSFGSAIDVTGNITTTGSLRGPSSFTIDPATHGDNTGTVVIAGDLTVNGTTTTINSTTLTVDDKNLILASGTSNSSTADGSGLTIDLGSDGTATMTYTHATTSFDFNKDIKSPGATFSSDVTVTGVTASTGFSGKIHPVNGTTTNYLSLKDSNELNFYNSSDASQTLHINYDGGNVDLAGSAVTVRHSDKFVGIGTNSPDSKLEIEGNVSSTTLFSGFGGLRIQNANGAAHGVTAEMNFTAGTGSSNRGAAIGSQFTSAASGNDLYFATNAGNVTSTNTLTERLRITSAGNVGIGTTSPAVQLHIDEGTSNSYATMRLEGNNRGGDIEMYQGTVPVSTIRSDQSGNMYFKTSGAYGNSSVTTKLTIATAGNVGIGTDSPTALLQITPPNEHQNSFRIYRGGSSGYELNYLNMSLYQGDTVFNTTSTDSSGKRYLFQINGTEKVRIDQNGEVGIGTNAPSAPIDVVTNSVVYAAEFTQSNTSNGDGMLIQVGSTAAADYALTVRSDAGNTSVLAAKADGNVGIGTFTPSADLHIERGSNGNSGHFKMGHSRQRRGSVGISSSQSRWYKVMNYVAGEIFTGVAQLFHQRGGGFNQTGAFRTYNMSVAGYSNGIYGPTTATGDSGESGVGTLEFGSDEALYLRVNSSLYGGSVYFTFTGTGNGVSGGWTFNAASYSTSLP